MTGTNTYRPATLPRTLCLAISGTLLALISLNV